MNDFEKMLADRMDGASVKDIMPEYNKEGDWHKLSAKLKPVRNIALLRWMPYAAILLVGFIGGFLIRQSGTKSPSVTYKQAPANTLPAKTIIIHDTTIVTNTVAVLQSKNYNHNIIKKPIQSTTQGSNRPHNESQNINTPVSQQTEVAQVAEHRMHAVNLLDINNEDARVLVQQSRPKRQRLIDYLFPVEATASNTRITPSPTLIDLFKH